MIAFVNCPVCGGEYSLTGPDLTERHKQCECPLDEMAEQVQLDAQVEAESSWGEQYRVENGGLL